MRIISFIISISLLGLWTQPIPLGIKLIPMLLMGFYGIYNLIFRKVKKRMFKLPSLIVALLLMLFMGALRNGNPFSSLYMDMFKTINLLLLVWIVMQYLNIEMIKGKRSVMDLFVDIIYIPFLILIVANFIFYIILNSSSIGAADMGRAVMLSNIGIYVRRASFLFSPGNNAYSSIVGFFLVLSIYGFLFKVKRTVVIIGFFFAVITLLLSDTRSSFIYPFVIFIPLFYFLKKIKKIKKIFFFNFLPLIVIFGPILLISVMTILATIPELSFLQRSENDFETGNSRIVIWTISLIEFLNFKTTHLIGYGEFGHYQSRASFLWSYIFYGWENPELTTSHSILFTILFDYGYLGLMFVIYYQFKIMSLLKKNWEGNKEMCIMLLSFFIYWNLMGLTESFFGFYEKTTMIMFIFISVIVYYIDFNKKATKNHLILS